MGKIDTERLRSAVKEFKALSSPTNDQDLINAVSNAAKLMNTLIDELEKINN